MDEKKLKDKLCSAIEAEATMAVCYGRIAELIKNNKARLKFNRLSRESAKSKELLCGRLSGFGTAKEECGLLCEVCKLRPESFSLIGALQVGLETTKSAAKFYNELSARCDDKQDKKLFKELFKKQQARMMLLKREKRFGHEDEADSLAIDCCLPEALSKLWK
ncbi:MAG: hypothetical protein COV72_01840 [Candidatus Omnitrophica bacterium CG11_big_fil_rev_8_21_14_0_20_42_13]|uniref:Rubrerythrin diiron-binding domain-containing protein n=1 Tax=Candidatus Ghiorseimicrobium undicola TaxID=1974746 RepID=A0A2H0LZ22_9BACT|nr:MAG: hypothetical protein COV72_01840 [Candidatus Omnitrophica bacterium CG11_big_fil_rev_8_21_14_0_20_42_13]